MNVLKFSIAVACLAALPVAAVATAQAPGGMRKVELVELTCLNTQDGERYDEVIIAVDGQRTGTRLVSARAPIGLGEVRIYPASKGTVAVKLYEDDGKVGIVDERDSLGEQYINLNVLDSQKLRYGAPGGNFYYILDCKVSSF